MKQKNISRGTFEVWWKRACPQMQHYRWHLWFSGWIPCNWEIDVAPADDNDESDQTQVEDGGSILWNRNHETLGSGQPQSNRWGRCNEIESEIVFPCKWEYQIKTRNAGDWPSSAKKDLSRGLSPGTVDPTSQQQQQSVLGVKFHPDEPSPEFTDHWVEVGVTGTGDGQSQSEFQVTDGWKQ